MPQREGETDYKYEDYASEMATYRLPQTAALVKQQMKITLDSGASFELEFTDRNKATWKSSSDRGSDWCEVVEVAQKTYFIDMTFASQPRQTQTFVVNTDTRQVLGVRSVMREGERSLEPSTFMIPAYWAIQQSRRRGASRRQRAICSGSVQSILTTRTRFSNMPI